MIAVRSGAAVAFAAAIALVVGCAGDADKFGEVSGTVTYDGKLVEEGAITFHPANGPTVGDAIKGGKYTAKKVPIGTSKVTIDAAKVIGKKKAYDSPDSPEVPITEPYIPAKYNQKSELSLDVKPGMQAKDFDLAK